MGRWEYLISTAYWQFHVISEDSYSLMHTCRVAIARHMISVDKWNSRNVEKLPLPRTILDYLLFKEYERMGLIFMKGFPLIQDYLKDNLTDYEICNGFERLSDWTGSSTSSPLQSPVGSSSQSRSSSLSRSDDEQEAW